MDKLQALKECTVEGNYVRPPAQQLDAKIYGELKKALVNIGGVWKGGKIQAFEFKSDPTELLNEISGGANRNLKKEDQWYATPKVLAERLVLTAKIKLDDKILEPSAGEGAILDAIFRKHFPEFIDVEYIEMNTERRHVLATKYGLFSTTGHTAACRQPALNYDFLTLSPIERYDKIIANPPFANNQDIDHVQHMYECLKPGGRIVSVMSNHWRTSQNKKERIFRSFIDVVNAEVVDLPADTFKESGTSIAACYIIVDKPE